MSTIASPRPSISLSSRRTSTSTETGTRSSSTTRAQPPATQRRNRTALRDYYGLKAAGAGNDIDKKEVLVPEDVPVVEEIDKPGFDAEQYVKDVLSREGLEGILRVEARLVNDIRGIDGERKALVYDNYSKLIDATDTIHKMRTSMDPLTPTTSTLTPAISHIAETAASLAQSLDTSTTQQDGEALTVKEKQQKTVQWVLDAPSRLRTLRIDGQEDRAQQDWVKVSRLLQHWSGVEGVEKIREECQAAMQAGSDA